MRVAAAALAVAALAAGCGGASGSATTGAPTSATTATTGAAGSAADCSLAAPAPSGTHHYAKPAAVLAAGSRYAIVMRTSCGTIRIVLDRARGGPIPNSIAFLVAHRFFDGLTFHRVVPGFVEQGGDPQGTGLGGPGYTVVGPVPSGYRYHVGDVAMAKTGTQAPGTAGSQFFVISGAQGAALPPLYGLLGHARDAASLATIRRIDALGVGDGAPSQPVSIVSARLVKLP